jgi:hypothetical protein
MAGLFLVAALFIAWAVYTEHQAKQRKARLAEALQQEILSEFPDYTQGITIGVAAKLANEICDKKSIYNQAEKNKIKLKKRPGYQEVRNPVDGKPLSAKAEEVQFLMLADMNKVREAFMSVLPIDLRSKIDKLPVIEQMVKISNIIDKSIHAMEV